MSDFLDVIVEHNQERLETLREEIAARVEHLHKGIEFIPKAIREGEPVDVGESIVRDALDILKVQRQYEELEHQQSYLNALVEERNKKQASIRTVTAQIKAFGRPKKLPDLDELKLQPGDMQRFKLDRRRFKKPPIAFPSKPLKPKDLGFKTKKALREKIKEVLNRWEHNRKGVEGEDREFIIKVLHHHPNASQKIGPDGISKLYVARDPAGNQCFRITRFDGIDTDISYTKCLTPPNDKTYFMTAARYLVKEQIARFKEAFFREREGEEVRCELTGQVITLETCHVDHKEPYSFEKLADDFLAEEGLAYDQVELMRAAGGYGTTFADYKLAARWLDYHDEHAVLRVLSVKGNLSVARRT